MNGLTKSQINKLGERLRGTPDPTEADSHALNIFVTEQDSVRLEVETAIRELCSANESVSSRLKTKTSILEKLRRDRTRLFEMQDIVGVRVVTPGDRTTQDALVRRCVERWPRNRVYDRRAKPQHGYRAVHVVAYLNDRPAEIQIRTSRQHKWAELFEKAGDKWGREIRYGGPVSPAFASRQEMVRQLLIIADRIDFFESNLSGPFQSAEILVSIERYLDYLRKDLLEEP